MKKWTLRLLAFVVIALPVAVVGVSYMKAYSNPYGTPNLAGIDVPTFNEVEFPFSHAFNKDKSLPFTGSAIIDVDGDATPEVFIGGGYEQQDAVLRFDGAKFTDATDTLGKGLTKSGADTTFGAAVIDADNDGRMDIFIARDSGITLYLNKADGFSAKKLDIPFDAKSTPLSIALADLNHDGFVDMYVSTYIKLDQVEGENIFNKEGYGSTSLLLLNNGDNTFSDITEKAGVSYVHNTFVAAFSDVDRDGDQDIVVAHDTGHVLTWRNNGDMTFASAENPSSKVYGYPMGLAIGDYNNDALMDFFFSNVSSTPPRFLAKGDLRDDQVFHTPLMLFQNQGDFTFRDVAPQTRTGAYEFSWGAVFDDLNNDGREDLLIAQNYVALPLQKLFRAPGRVLLQRADRTFDSAEKKMGLVNRNYEITPLVADFNNDGYRDVVRINLAGPSRAFISGGGNNAYLKVRLPETAKSLGALVEVELNSGETLTQQFTSGEGLASDQSHELIFGLGRERAVRQMRVHYADGTTRDVATPTINSVVTLE